MPPYENIPSFKTWKNMPFFKSGIKCHVSTFFFHLVYSTWVWPILLISPPTANHATTNDCIGGRQRKTLDEGELSICHPFKTYWQRYSHVTNELYVVAKHPKNINKNKETPVYVFVNLSNSQYMTYHIPTLERRFEGVKKKYYCLAETFIDGIKELAFMTLAGYRPRTKAAQDPILFAQSKEFIHDPSGVFQNVREKSLSCRQKVENYWKRVTCRTKGGNNRNIKSTRTSATHFLFLQFHRLHPARSFHGWWKVWNWTDYLKIPPLIRCQCNIITVCGVFDVIF